MRRSHAVAHRHYRPGALRGDALLIRSEESKTLPDEDWTKAWSRLLTGNLLLETVPGAHSDLVTPEHAPALADRLRAALDQASV